MSLSFPNAAGTRVSIGRRISETAPSRVVPTTYAIATSAHRSASRATTRRLGFHATVRIAATIAAHALPSFAVHPPDRLGRRSYYQIQDKTGVWKLPPPLLVEPPPHPNALDVERAKAALPERFRHLAEFTHVSGLDEWPPPPPREVTDEELIELGLMEKPLEPPEPAQPEQPAAPSNPLMGMDAQALTQLLHTLQNGGVL